MRGLLAVLLAFAFPVLAQYGPIYNSGTPITTAKIPNGAITTNKLSPDAVIGAKILTGAVTTSKLGDGAVTTAKLGADLALTGAVRIDGTTFQVDAANNRVGIGTASPGYALEVAGEIATTGGNQVSVRNGATVSTMTSTAITISGGGTLAIGPTITQANSRMWCMDSDSQEFGDFQIAQSDTQTGACPGTGRLYIDRDANVGVGTVTPQTLMDVAGGIGTYSRTVAQLVAITPTAVGQIYFCNNCSPAKIVVSTGTAAANFAAVDGGGFQ